MNDPTSCDAGLWLAVAVEKALEEARRDERRACAEIALTLPVGYFGLGPEKVRQAIAAAIRARGEAENNDPRE